MRLNTDTQHMGYVLREGETDPPAGLRKALRVSNRLQDIVLAAMTPGKQGNAVLADALRQMHAEGIDGSIYSHPIGEHGHGAGPLIGLWDRQVSIPGRGELPVRSNSWFSIELQATSRVPEWGDQLVRSSQEEDAFVDERGGVHWVLSRQEQLHLIR
jgi:Xaa-Pro aminopeptidase